MRAATFQRLLFGCLAAATATLTASLVLAQDEEKPAGDEQKNAQVHYKYLQKLVERTRQSGQPEQYLYSGVFAGADDGFGGATLEPVDESLRAQLELPKKEGLVVTGLNPGSPAAQSGLQVNDILLKLGDAALAKGDDLTKTLKDSGEKPVSLHVIRSGKPVTITIKPTYRLTFGPAQVETNEYFVGLPVRGVDDAMRAHLSVPAGQGLVVTDVTADSPASKAGLKPYDILLKVGDKAIGDTETLVSEIQASQGKPINVAILRGGKSQTIQVVPERRTRKVDQGGGQNFTAWQFVTPHVQGQVSQFAPFGLAHPNLNQFNPSWVHPNNAAQDLGQVWSRAAVDGKYATAATQSAALEKKVDDLKKEIAGMREDLTEIKKALSGK
jgi:hypothetical protein